MFKYIALDEDLVSFNCRIGKIANSREKGKIYYAEVSIHTPEKNYGSRVEAEDTYIALDLLKDELANNITSHKDKTRTLHKREAQKFKQDIHDIDVVS